MNYGTQVRNLVLDAIKKTVEVTELPDSDQTLDSLGINNPEMCKKLQREIAREISERVLTKKIGLNIGQITRLVGLSDLEPETTLLEIEERLTPVFAMLIERANGEVAVAEAEPAFDEGMDEAACEADLPGDSTILGDPD